MTGHQQSIAKVSQISYDKDFFIDPLLMVLYINLTKITDSVFYYEIIIARVLCNFNHYYWHLAVKKVITLLIQHPCYIY
jgi:hypothetical protein